jgi:hypothetical protein
MDMHIVVELVFSSTFQISNLFVLIVPLSHESSNLGFIFILSNRDFSHYRQSFSKPQTASKPTFHDLSNAYNYEAFGEIRILLKPGMAVLESLFLELHLSKQQQ